VVEHLRWPGHPVTRESFLVLLESTVIKFVWSTGKLSFSERKVNLWMRSVSYSKMNTLLFSVFLLFVLTEMYSLSKNEKYLRLRGDELFVVHSR